MRNAAHDKWISDPSASASMAFHLTRFALRSRNAVLMIRLALRSSIFAASQGFQSLSLSSAPSQHARLLAICELEATPPRGRGGSPLPARLASDRRQSGRSTPTQSAILYAFCTRRRPKWGGSRIDSFLSFGMRLATTARAQRLAATALIRNREEQGCENE
jgi:hypothetical protein